MSAARKAKRAAARKPSKPLVLSTDQREVLARAFDTWKGAAVAERSALAHLNDVAQAIGGKEFRLKQLEDGRLELYDHDYRKGG